MRLRSWGWAGRDWGRACVRPRRASASAWTPTASTWPGASGWRRTPAGSGHSFRGSTTTWRRAARQGAALSAQRSRWWTSGTSTRYAFFKKRSLSSKCVSKHITQTLWLKLWWTSHFLEGLNVSGIKRWVYRHFRRVCGDATQQHVGRFSCFTCTRRGLFGRIYNASILASTKCLQQDGYGVLVGIHPLKHFRVGASTDPHNFVYNHVLESCFVNFLLWVAPSLCLYLDALSPLPLHKRLPSLLASGSVWFNAITVCFTHLTYWNQSVNLLLFVVWMHWIVLLFLFLSQCDISGPHSPLSAKSPLAVDWLALPFHRKEGKWE